MHASMHRHTYICNYIDIDACMHTYVDTIAVNTSTGDDRPGYSIHMLIYALTKLSSYFTT